MEPECLLQHAFTHAKEQNLVSKEGGLWSDRRIDWNGFQVITRVQLPSERVDANTFAYTLIAAKRIFVLWYKLDLIIDTHKIVSLAGSSFFFSSVVRTYSRLSHSADYSFTALLPLFSFRLMYLHQIILTHVWVWGRFFVVVVVQLISLTVACHLITISANSIESFRFVSYHLVRCVSVCDHEYTSPIQRLPFKHLICLHSFFSLLTNLAPSTIEIKSFIDSFCF